jgi:uncharacterized protein YbbC (DUF1343 family)
MILIKQLTKVSIFSKFLYALLFFAACHPKAIQQRSNDKGQTGVIVGAARFDAYLTQLKGKKIGLVVNQTSLVEQTHLADTLLKQGIQIGVIFAPEHGFRGNADAGEKINNSVDKRTGIPIISIYGKKNKPDSSDLKNIDLLVFDIQDVGLRYYTYISTLQYIMEAAAENHIPVLVLDRPNPNGHYLDGLVLDKSLKSFIGMQPVPTVYGMTIGEYAQLLNGESWLNQHLKCSLNVIPCQGYDHKTFYDLPVKPSPNLPNLRSIYLYSSLCYFEGTNISLGRGTDKQFQLYGAPDLPKTGFKFTPMPNEGAKEPPHKGKICYGWDLSQLKLSDLQAERRINLSYLINAYQQYPDKNNFFLKSNFFDKLAGSTQLREQLIAGTPEAEIKKSWQPGLNHFKTIRKKYLLYTDFDN